MSKSVRPSVAQSEPVMQSAPQARTALCGAVCVGSSRRARASRVVTDRIGKQTNTHKSQHVVIDINHTFLDPIVSSQASTRRKHVSLRWTTRINLWHPEMYVLDMPSGKVVPACRKAVSGHDCQDNFHGASLDSNPFASRRRFSGKSLGSFDTQTWSWSLQRNLPCDM